MKTASHQELLPQIPGITPTQATLLEASGVASPEDLARSNPDKLLRWMAEVNSETRLVRRLPSLEHVSSWVRAARSFQPV